MIDRARLVALCMAGAILTILIGAAGHLAGAW
jgi:hypothetical protein